MMEERYLPFSELLKDSLRATIFPWRCLKKFKKNISFRINYWIVIPFVVIWGFFYGILHFWGLYGKMPFQIYSSFSSLRGIFLAFTVGSITNWLMAICGLYLMGRINQREISLPQVEIISFYLWFLWAVMPLLGFIHRLGVPPKVFSISLFKPQVKEIIVVHFGWLVFPFLIYELFWILDYLISPEIPLKKVFSFFLALGIVTGLRIIGDGTATLLLRKLSKVKYSIYWWEAASFLAIFGFIQFLSFRLYLVKYSKIFLSIFLLFVFLGTLLIGWCLL